MGNLMWHQWGRLLAITSAIYMAWGSFWAFFYRKFFWDMIGAELGPAGLMRSPGANTKPFVTIIVNIPLVQIFTLLMALFTLALEAPLPMLEKTSLHRSFQFRAVFYFLAGFTGILVYQTVDCAVYYVITSAVYTRAAIKGEIMDPASKKVSSEA